MAEGETKTCPDCYGENSTDASFCKQCSYRFLEAADGVNEGSIEEPERQQAIERACSKGHINTVDAGFCRECGEPIENGVACPRCHNKNRPEARYCAECSHRLPVPLPNTIDGLEQEIQSLDGQVVAVTNSYNAIMEKVNKFRGMHREIVIPMYEKYLKVNLEYHEAYCSKFPNDVAAAQELEKVRELIHVHESASNKKNKALRGKDAKQKLTEEEEKVLSVRYREACRKFHPDKVKVENRIEATEVLAAIEEAYRNSALDQLDDLVMLSGEGAKGPQEAGVQLLQERAMVLGALLQMRRVKLEHIRESEEAQLASDEQKAEASIQREREELEGRIREIGRRRAELGSG